MRVSPLTEDQRSEALAFLDERPLDNVIMSGHIRDHGIGGNRGRFYGCRNRRGALEGVALVGRGISFDSRSESATELFAALARRSAEAHMLMGECSQVRRFWDYYAPGGGRPRKVRRVTILERRRAREGCEEASDLRPALPEETDEVAELHAALVREETGDDPLAADAESFRLRCLSRIERGRTWIWSQAGRVVFKADVVAQTPAAAYVEGVYVRPAARGRGHGRRCLAQMSRLLHAHVDSVCLFADDENARARDFYLSVGYAPVSRYRIIYF